MHAITARECFGSMASLPAQEGVQIAISNLLTGSNNRNVKRFRGGLVFQAHRLLYHSTLGLRVIKKKNPARISFRNKTVYLKASFVYLKASNVEDEGGHAISSVKPRLKIESTKKNSVMFLN